MKLTFLILIGVCVLLFPMLLIIGLERVKDGDVTLHERRRQELQQTEGAYHDALKALREEPSCAHRKGEVLKVGHAYIELQREVHGDHERHFNAQTLERDITDLEPSDSANS